MHPNDEVLRYIMYMYILIAITHKPPLGLTRAIRMWCDFIEVLTFNQSVLC